MEKKAFNNEVPIDYEKALQNLQGQNEVFIKMLHQFHELTLLTVLEQLRDAYDASDHSSFAKLCQTIQGSAGFIGAGPLYHLSELALAKSEKNKTVEMYQLYPRFVELGCEFRVEATIRLKLNQSKNLLSLSCCQMEMTLGTLNQ